MKRFRFSLRPLALLRANTEMRALEAFAAAVRRCVASEAKLAAQQRRVAAIEAEVLAGRRERYRGTDAAYTIAGYRNECAAVAAAQKALATAREEMQRRRMEYLEARRRAEAVRRLEDKARAAHQTTASREEQAAFDELSGGRSAREAGTAVRNPAAIAP